jgi:hypothetical protein
VSRRSRLYGSQAQYRAASRMTVDTKMWAEQPLLPLVDRYRTTPVEVIMIPPPPWYPPTGMRYVASTVDAGPNSISMTFYAGEQVMVCCSTNTNQPQTIGPGWTIVDQGSIGSVTWAVITRTFLVDETVVVSSVGAETHPWNKFSVRGYAFQGLSPYKFHVRQVWNTISPTVELHSWQGAWSSYRLRCLVSNGCYNAWMTGGSGHGDLDLGGIDPRPSWYQASGPPETFMRTTWASGFFTHDSIGAYGTPTWAELHIELGRL